MTKTSKGFVFILLDVCVASRSSAATPGFVTACDVLQGTQEQALWAERVGLAGNH
jgi:hypothetical protein